MHKCKTPTKSKRLTRWTCHTCTGQWLLVNPETKAREAGVNWGGAEYVAAQPAEWILERRQQ